jgi:hypothetical protein
MNHSNPMKDDQAVDAHLDKKVLDAIGRALKAHYDDLVKAPLPERFLELLADLEAEEGDAEPGGSDAAD